MLVRRLRIRADATLEPAGEGRIALVEGHMRFALGPLGPGLRAAVEALAQRPLSDPELVEVVAAAEDELAAVRVQMVVRRLAETGWTTTVLDADGDAGRRTLATLEPIGHTPPRPRHRPDLQRPLALSRFALVRVSDGRAVVESPRLAATLVLHEPRLAGLLAGLATPTAPDALGEAMDGIGLARDDASALARFLAEVELLVDPATEQDDALALWNLPDLLFHARSRLGRNLGEFGGTYRFEGSREPLPATKPVTGETVALPDPATHPPRPMGLFDAVETRRSRREHDPDRPITLAELGELLHRSARQRGVVHDGHEELASRPYPAGGALYELELYPLVHACAGLDAGLYRYDPAGHRLESVRAPGPETTLLLEYARLTAVLQAPPQVLLVVAARFGRAMWKYESMAYALVLKHVGVLYHQLALAATAMDLALCPLGGGHSDAFSRAADLDYYAESSVGELILGRPAPAPAG